MGQLDQSVIDSIKELTGAVTELKVTNNTMVVKMEQLYTSIERLESSIEKLEKVTESINSSVSGQEKRLTVLEQTIPANLAQDMAVLKSTQESQSKIMWLIGSAAAISLVNSILKLLN